MISFLQARRLTYNVAIATQSACFVPRVTIPADSECDRTQAYAQLGRLAVSSYPRERMYLAVSLFERDSSRWKFALTALTNRSYALAKTTARPGGLRSAW